MTATESVPLRDLELESSPIETWRMEGPPQVPSAKAIPLLEEAIPFPHVLELTRFREEGFKDIGTGRVELVSEARHLSKPQVRLLCFILQNGSQSR